MKRTLIGMVGVVALAGCGSGSSGGTSAPTVHTAADPATIASQFGCLNPTPDPEPELYVGNSDTCTFRGWSTTVATFASEGAEQRWRQAALQISGGDGSVVVGDGYVIEANTAADALRIASKLGDRTQ